MAQNHTTHPVTDADVKPAHAMTVDEVAETLATSKDSGLSKATANRRLVEHGPNRLAEAKRVSNLQLLLRQFASPVMVLLGAAMVLSAALDDYPEAVAIGVVVLINALIGFTAERRAVRSMEALKRMNVQTARVRRGGTVQLLPAEGLVPGDVVILEAGDRVTADVRLADASTLSIDESVLTGESLPVDKEVEPIDPSAELHAQRNMLFQGTTVLAGTAMGLVVATGVKTQLGRIADLVANADDDVSPLEKNLVKLARQLIWLTLLIAVAIGLVGLWSGQPLGDMAKATIALAIAAIPEGLPIVATLALARGLLRMARRNALVRSLGAVETLGSTTVIMTDKTGTLTENTMCVDRLILSDGIVELSDADDERAQDIIRLGVLCSNAAHDGANGEAIGDPLEVAFLLAANDLRMSASSTRQLFPREREYAFDSVRRLMATVHTSPGFEPDEVLLAVKGAPEAVLSAVSHVHTGQALAAFDPPMRARLDEQINELAGQGFRLVAVARRRIDRSELTDDPYRALELLGVVALRDPPRADIRASIAACHRAGVRLFMITGDHPVTAEAIAKDVGFNAAKNGDRVQARVTPQDKLDLVAECQSQNEIVAMTGDGVNDAPALSQADIGIAMGVRGTDAAREAADMVLRDDAFSTIVAAIREGRVIFGNIRRFCVYLLSCNLGEVLLIGVALFAGLPLPLLPLQILFLNLVTDVFPAFALATGEGDDRVLEKPPRPATETILTQRHWFAIAFHGVMIALAPFAAFLYGLFYLETDATGAATLAFLTIGLAQLWHVFTMRDPSDHPVVNAVVRNPYVWGALVLCVGLLAATVFVAPLREALDIVPPNLEGWMAVFGLSFVPLLAGQLYLAVRRWQTRNGN